jgi:hypothetical protein
MDSLQQDAEASVGQAAGEAAAARDAADAAARGAAAARQQRLEQDSAWAQRLERARDAWQQVLADCVVCICNEPQCPVGGCTATSSMALLYLPQLLCLRQCWPQRLYCGAAIIAAAGTLCTCPPENPEKGSETVL